MKSLPAAHILRDNVQQQIAQAVARRGYREGWTPQQFAARQVAKLAEELGELAQHIDLPEPLGLVLTTAGQIARQMFDNPALWANPTTALWANPTTCTPVSCQIELTDIQVVVFCLADVLNSVMGPCDVTDAVLEKARTDAKRGVRK